MPEDIEGLYAELQRADADLERSHPDDDAWQRLASGELGLAERDRLVRHSAVCPPCRAICRGLLLLAGEAPALDPDAPRGGALAHRAPLPPRVWGLGGGLAAVAAAAAWLLLRPPTGVTPVTPAPGGEPLRELSAAPFVLVAPVGTVRTAPETLRWLPYPGAQGYRVEVLDGRGDDLWSTDATTGTWCAWPAEIALRPGRYYWRVAAKLDGRTILSALASFDYGP